MQQLKKEKQRANEPKIKKKLENAFGEKLYENIL